MRLRHIVLYKKGGEAVKKGNGRLLILLALLLALAARFVYPAGREAIRARMEPVFAADLRRLELVEAMGRAVSSPEERIAAFKAVFRGGAGESAA